MRHGLGITRAAAAAAVGLLGFSHLLLVLFGWVLLLSACRPSRQINHTHALWTRVSWLTPYLPVPHAPPHTPCTPTPNRTKSLPAGSSSEWQPVEVSPREGARVLGVPTMDGEEEEGPHTSFRVPRGVTRAN